MANCFVSGVGLTLSQSSVNLGTLVSRFTILFHFQRLKDRRAPGFRIWNVYVQIAIELFIKSCVSRRNIRLGKKLELVDRFHPISAGFIRASRVSLHWRF